MRQEDTVHREIEVYRGFDIWQGSDGFYAGADREGDCWFLVLGPFSFHSLAKVRRAVDAYLEKLEGEQ